MKPYKIILFDGVCNLCHGGVQFTIKRDQNRVFKFASLQSDFGQKTLNDLGMDPLNLSTFVLLENQRVHTKSSAALRVARELSGPISLLFGFIIVPKILRDWVYTLVATNRYKWFGKQQECWLPDPSLKDLFVD